MVTASLVVGAPAANAAVATCGPGVEVIPASPGEGELAVVCGNYEGLDLYASVHGKKLPNRTEMRVHPLMPIGPVPTWIADYKCLAPGTVT